MVLRVHEEADVMALSAHVLCSHTFRVPSSLLWSRKVLCVSHIVNTHKYSDRPDDRTWKVIYTMHRSHQDSITTHIQSLQER